MSIFSPDRYVGITRFSFNPAEYADSKPAPLETRPPRTGPSELPPIEYINKTSSPTLWGFFMALPCEYWQTAPADVKEAFFQALDIEQVSITTLPPQEKMAVLPPEVAKKLASVLGLDQM